MARAKAKASPSTHGGEGLALAGLIMGYISFALTVVAFFIFSATAIPALAGAQGRAMEFAEMSVLPVFQVTLLGTTLEEPRPGLPRPGFPADAGLTSKAELAEMLVGYSALTQHTLDDMSYEEYEVGNVSSSDPPDTILLRRSLDGGRSLVLLLDGTAKVADPGEVVGQDPPRSPAFLP